MEEKPKNKKTVVSIHKTFISDQEDFDGPSMFTGKTAESSEREEVEKRCKEKILERLSSSEGEDEKIFFEMYKTYQNAWSNNIIYTAIAYINQIALTNGNGSPLCKN